MTLEDHEERIAALEEKLERLINLLVKLYGPRSLRDSEPEQQSDPLTDPS